MMLTLGADLYTTSKLLGHADVKITQVYAKIINQKKDDAVNLVNGLFDWYGDFAAGCRCLVVQAGIYILVYFSIYLYIGQEN